ncbi:MAG: AAA family ATPase, partial [Pseudoclavibacter sp.]
SVARRRAGGFSLGMSQRLGLAVALLGDPHTLILDEPVNGLDPEGVTWLRGLLRSLAGEGRTVFLSSHLLSELALIAEHVVVIGRGELIADAPTASLIEPPGVGTETGRPHAAERVRVRVAPEQHEALLRFLAAQGVEVVSLSGDSAEIVGLPVDQVAVRAAEAGVVPLELTPVRRTLEEAYTELTSGAVEYRAGGTGGAGGAGATGGAR